MTKHTPGPWEWVEPPIVGYRAIYITASPNDPNAKHGPYLASDIGTLHRSGYETDGEWEANARLIAAAPDLLEACKEASKHLTWGDVDTEVAQMVNAAIAKAEADHGQD